MCFLPPRSVSLMESLEHRLSSLSVSSRCPPSDATYLLDLSVAPHGGNAVAVACSDFRLHLHDKQNLRLLQIFEGHKGPISAVRFSHQCVYSVYSSSLDGTVRLWDVRHSGNKAAQVFNSDSSHSFSSFDVSCNDSLLCGGTEQVNNEDSFLVFWDSRKPAHALLGVYSESHSDDITQVCFHPTDKDRLASGSTDGLVNVFDLTNGSEDEALVGTCNSESSVSALCWLEKDRLLCVSHDEGLRLWDLKSLDTEDQLTVYSTKDARTSGKVMECAVDYLIGGCWFDSEVLVFGGSGEGDVHLFTCDKSGLNLVRTLRSGHKATVRCFGFDSQSLSLFTGGEDGVLLRWSPDDKEPGTGLRQTFGSSRQEGEEQSTHNKMKSESVMRLKSRPHKKHKFSRDKKNTST